MNQIKIGRLIAEMRREQKMTQRQLADQLNISDKTVSKWETGNGLPEVALMMPLCEALQISVNELLSGELLTEKGYRDHAEKIIMDLMKEKQHSKKMILLEFVVVILMMISSITMILLAGYLQMETWLRILLVGIAGVVIGGGIFVAVSLEMSFGTFECPRCKARFVPGKKEFIMSPHSLTTRYLRCPECGEKSHCKRRLTH